MISASFKTCCSVLCCVIKPNWMLGIISSLSFSSLIRSRMHRSASLEREFNRLMGRWLEGRVGLSLGLGKVMIMACFQDWGKVASVRMELMILSMERRYSGGSFFRCLFVMLSGPAAFFGLRVVIWEDSSSMVTGRRGGEGGGVDHKFVDGRYDWWGVVIWWGRNVVRGKSTFECICQDVCFFSVCEDWAVRAIDRIISGLGLIFDYS